MAVGKGTLKVLTERYKCDANDAVFLKLVHNEEDVINDEGAFHPYMSHQIFGESETVFGYTDLKICLYYHGGSLLTYLNMTYSQKISPSLGISPDPVLPKIAKHLPEGFLSNKDEFIARLSKENNFTPMGNKIHSYSRHDADYEVYQADSSVTRLKEYHERLQMFVLWFIDAASFIDSDDEKWNYFLLFQKKKGGLIPEYNIVGYMTVYHYYAYPDKFRPRISQMLILPPYQRTGHGTQLLEEVCRYYVRNPDARDITVEDPSEDFVRRRDFIDCRNCMKLDAFQKQKLLSGFSAEMKTSALLMYKITKQQARRVYEILRLRCTDCSDETSYQSYRLDVKNRLNLPFQKQANDLKKLKNVLSTEEYNEAVVGLSHEERIQRLDDAFKQLEEEYRYVIDSIATR